jgi:putative transposase
MRYAASEKLEIIRLVEQSHLVSRCLLIATNKYRHDTRWKHSAFPAPPSTAGMTASRRAVWKRWRIANRAPSGSGIAFQIPCGNGSILFACRDQSDARLVAISKHRSKHRSSLALSRPELSPRELAVTFTDTENYFVSEASVYRLLKAEDLITRSTLVQLVSIEQG